MKKVLLVVIGLLAFALNNNSFAQTKIENDSILSKIENSLPADWYMVIGNHNIEVRKRDTVYILKEARVITKQFSKEERIQRILANGEATTPTLILRYENRWSQERVDNARANNTRISKARYELPKKYEVEDIYDARRGSFPPDYEPKDEEEALRIENFKNENIALDQEYINIPQFHSSNYSIYLIAKIGSNSNDESVYPGSISNEINKIVVLFRELAR